MKTYKIILKGFFTDEISEITYQATDWDDARVKGIAIREEMRASDAISNIQDIIDIETGETFHNRTTKETKAMDSKEKSALGWEIANWLHKHEDFQVELADNIFFGWKNDQEITIDDIKEMFDKFGYTNLAFTAEDFLKYLNRKDRKSKLIEMYH